MLVAINRCGSQDGAVWLCRCDCGAIVERSASALNRKLRSGAFASCGCRRRRPAIVDGLRVCTRCKKSKSVNDFVKNSRSADNIGNWCDVCRKNWRAENKELLAESKAKAYRKDIEENRAKSRARSAKNKDQSNKRSKSWRENNPEKRRQVANSWVKRNRDYACFISAKRRSAAIRATPPWADLDAIRKIYALAKEASESTGIQHHVDHIVPLVSVHVSGLHVPENLRVIPARQNISKSNRVWPDMP